MLIFCIFFLFFFELGFFLGVACVCFEVDLRCFTVYVLFVWWFKLFFPSFSSEASFSTKFSTVLSMFFTFTLIGLFFLFFGENFLSFLF